MNRKSRVGPLGTLDAQAKYLQVKHFDPLACSRCGQGAFALTFTNDDVAPLCAACSDK